MVTMWGWRLLWENSYPFRLCNRTHFSSTFRRLWLEFDCTLWSENFEHSNMAKWLLNRTEHHTMKSTIRTFSSPFSIESMFYFYQEKLLNPLLCSHSVGKEWVQEWERERDGKTEETKRERIIWMHINLRMSCNFNEPLKLFQSCWKYGIYYGDLLIRVRKKRSSSVVPKVMEYGTTCVCMWNVLTSVRWKHKMNCIVVN